MRPDTSLTQKQPPVDLPGAQPRACAWTVPQIEGKDRPLSRTFHAACVVDDRWLVVFGGSTGVKLLSCTWEFDLESERWQKIQNSTPVVPAGRYGHTLTYIKKKREILLVGGLDANKVACRDSVYTLNVTTWAWTAARLSPERSTRKGNDGATTSNTCVGRIAALATARGLHTANLLSSSSNKLVVFGGIPNADLSNNAVSNRHSSTRTSQLIQIDTDTHHLMEPRTTGAPPSPRYSHASVVLDLGNQRPTLLVTGGVTLFADLLCSDVFVLELHSWAWQNVPGLGTGTPDTDCRLSAGGGGGGGGGGEGGGRSGTGGGGAGSGGGAVVGARHPPPLPPQIIGRDLWDEGKLERERERERVRIGLAPELGDEGLGSEALLRLPAPGLANHTICALPRRPGATELAFIFGGRRGRRYLQTHTHTHTHTHTITHLHTHTHTQVLFRRYVPAATLSRASPSRLGTQPAHCLHEPLGHTCQEASLQRQDSRRRGRRRS
jgi:uncharacterized membrane protein YgcG